MQVFRSVPRLRLFSDRQFAVVKDVVGDLRCPGLVIGYGVARVGKTGLGLRTGNCARPKVRLILRRGSVRSAVDEVHKRVGIVDCGVRR